MKKLFSYLIITIILSSAQLFSYLPSEGMIDFFVQTNQLRIRLDKLGVNAKIGDFKLLTGINGSQNASGIILMNKDDINGNIFIPSVMLAFGYKNDIFAIGGGLEYYHKATNYQVYTPVITATALNDRFRINIPVSIGVGSATLKNSMVISTGIEARYYVNAGPLYHLRFYFNYGNSKINVLNKQNRSFIQQSVGGQLRVYFRVQAPNNILIDPIIRVVYDQALATKYNGLDPFEINDNYSITAKSFLPSVGGHTGAGAAGGSGANANPDSALSGGYVASIPKGYKASQPYRFAFALPVGFSSDSEFISFYLEPALSFTLVGGKNITTSDGALQRKEPFYTFGYVVYGEIKLRPVPTLEWYTEVQTGGATVAGDLAQGGNTSLVFNANTGITWYF